MLESIGNIVFFFFVRCPMRWLSWPSIDTVLSTWVFSLLCGGGVMSLQGNAFRHACQPPSYPHWRWQMAAICKDGPPAIKPFYSDRVFTEMEEWRCGSWNQPPTNCYLILSNSKEKQQQQQNAKFEFYFNYNIPIREKKIRFTGLHLDLGYSKNTWHYLKWN